MTPEQRIPVNIEDEMRQSYLDYAMSVIVGRALPDVRDGLKPVHRRILHTMNVTGNTPSKAYRKAARIVGDVMGNYHPHGDSAIYDTIVRMVQEFSMRYPLVDGQGNFGSLDGDPAAAYRYTEVRMHRFAELLLADIDKETVNWQPNYDESKQEPTVLPSRVPNLLVNGAEGIAVGMATKIPPHNLREVISALIALIDQPDLEMLDLLEYIPGPDFPTAGFIYGRQGILDAYATGRGKITVRAKIDIEEHKGRESVIINELPYQVNKARLVEEIADAVRQKRMEGISDLRDESDKDGVRVVLELKKDGNAGVIENLLYKITNCQVTFGIILLCLVDGQPKILSLKEILDEFITFRREVVTRRTQFDLRKAEERAHILEGLKIALDNLDAVITLIRASANPEAARSGLMERFGLSERQAQAILDMRLQKLTGLERDKVVAEYKEVQALIESLRAILGDDVLLMKVIREELIDVRDRFGDVRRTRIVDATGELDLEDLIAREQVVVTVSKTGYIKRHPLSEYHAQHRGGKGKISMETKEEDVVDRVFVASTHDYIMVFTNAGRVYWLKIYQIPHVGRTARGKAIINLVNLQAPGEEIAALLTVSEFTEGRNVVFATRQGVVKRTDLMAFSNPRGSGIIALKIDEGDEVIAVQLTDGEQHIMLGARQGKAIRFPESGVRKMGRSARGVRGITLAPGDAVVSMIVVDAHDLVADEGENHEDEADEVEIEETETNGAERRYGGPTILTVSQRGFGKRTPVNLYPLRRRGGQGVYTLKISERNGPVVAMHQVEDDDQLMIVTDSGKLIRLRVVDISITGRQTQGVRLIEIDDDQHVTSCARLDEEQIADAADTNGFDDDDDTNDANNAAAADDTNNDDDANDDDVS